MCVEVIVCYIIVVFLRHGVLCVVSQKKLQLLEHEVPQNPSLLLCPPIIL